MRAAIWSTKAQFPGACWSPVLGAGGRRQGENAAGRPQPEEVAAEALRECQAMAPATGEGLRVGGLEQLGKNGLDS